ncbi:hypothetical protein [Flavobacterium sp.]|uniref:hypothetical protein n=1 Tax=Flavobacterium sp. TaxID=239 RepID=UPI00260DCD46|nr:hypothetical protein [Flavobacterium sp.]
MLRKVLLLFFLILSIDTFSQSVEKSIILKDKDTEAPIEDATVSILKTKQNLLSNANGVVTFELNGVSSIQIKHPSYLGVTIRSIVLKDKSTVIYLKNNINDLDEIVVTKKHPQKILASLIENSKQRLTIPGRLKVYSREFFKLNGNYSYYNDGLMNFQLLDKSRKINAVLLVEQNRSKSLIEENISDDLLGYNLNDIMENYYNFKYLNPLLEAQAKKEYDFVIKVYSKNKELNIISAIPNETATGLLDDFSIIYDPHKKIIIEVSSVVSPMVLSKMKDKTSRGSRNINQSSFKTIYKLQNNNYYLLCSKEEIGFEKIEKDHNKDIQVRNYFLTTNFSTQNYAYKDSEVYKDKTLYNKKDVILSDYWNESGLTATDEEQKIISSIEEQN